MNWKLTRPHHRVEFNEGEPICAVMPQRRNELEQFTPVMAPLQSASDWQDHLEFVRARRRLIIRHVRAAKRFEDGVSPREPKEWQGDYMRGTTVNGKRFEEHQRRIKLRPFTTMDDDSYVRVGQS
jgi:hypothetical protein